MKNKLKGFVIGVSITTMLMSTFVFAEGIKQNIEVLFNSVNLTVNGKIIEADNILYDGTTYVPIRTVAELLGKEVGWDQNTNTASINDVGILKDSHIENQTIPKADEIKEKNTRLDDNSKAQEIEDFLKDNYSSVNTKLETVKFNYEVEEHDDINKPYDFCISLGIDTFTFENTLNSHLRSAKNQKTAQQDVELSRKQLTDFIKKMAEDIIDQMPNKRFLGQNISISYRYPALKMDKLTSKGYSWTNYEPIKMENEWPGERPDDYYKITRSMDRDVSYSDLAEQYSDDELMRSRYNREYNKLKYDGFKITKFQWVTFLNDVYESTW